MVGHGDAKVKGASLDERRDASRAAVELALQDAAKGASLMISLLGKTDADLTGVRPGQARFERCTFDNAKLDAWESFTAEFIDCHFAGRLKDVRFYGRPWGSGADRIDPLRTTNAFTGNDFRKADLLGVVFAHGIDIKKQKWPEGPQYVILDRIHQRIAKVRLGVLEWRDHEARQQALDMLQAASLLYSHQMTIIGRRVEQRWTAAPAIQERVWDELAAAIA